MFTIIVRLGRCSSSHDEYTSSMICRELKIEIPLKAWNKAMWEDLKKRWADGISLEDVRKLKARKFYLPIEEQEALAVMFDIMEEGKFTLKWQELSGTIMDYF